MQQHHGTPFVRTFAVLGGLAAFSVVAALAIYSNASVAQMAHRHGETECTHSDISCASTVTPAFAPDGSLWIAWAGGGRVWCPQAKAIAYGYFSKKIAKGFSYTVAIPQHRIRSC